MPWQEELYPSNWKEKARVCKERAEWKCEQCGIAHGTIRIGKKYGKPYKVRLTAAHLDHDPENPDARLIALCEECHLHYDEQLHVQHCRRTKQRKRYVAMIEAGQLELFHE